MPRAKIVLEGMTLVLRGAFNPAIFHPTWYQHNGLLPEIEAKEAKLGLVSQQFAAFSTERFSFQVDEGRFQVGTGKAEEFDALRDIAVGTFKLLGHTPLQFLGINRTVHFGAGTADIWHAVGHKLAPKEAWLPILEQPGLRSLSIVGVRSDGHQGAVNVRVEPSTNVQHGVFVEVNDHFAARTEEEGSVQPDSRLATVLDQEWQNSLARSQRVIDHLGELIWELHNEQRKVIRPSRKPARSRRATAKSP